MSKRKYLKVVFRILGGAIVFCLLATVFVFVTIQQRHLPLKPAVVYTLPTPVPQPTPRPGIITSIDANTKQYTSQESGFSIQFTASYKAEIPLLDVSNLDPNRITLHPYGDTSTTIDISQGADTANDLMSNPEGFYPPEAKRHLDYSLIPATLAVPSDAVAVAYSINTDGTQATESQVGIYIFLFDKFTQYDGYGVSCQNPSGSGICRQILPGLLSTFKIPSRADKTAVKK